MKDMYPNLSLQLSTPLENKLSSRNRKQLQVSYRFWISESRSYSMLRFSSFKVRCWRLVYSDNDTRLSGFEPVGLIRWPESEGSHVVCGISVDRGWSSVTDVLPTVQPRSWIRWEWTQENTSSGFLTWQVKSLNSLWYKIQLAITARQCFERTFSHHEGKCHPNQRGWFDSELGSHNKSSKYCNENECLTLIVMPIPSALLKLALSHWST